MVLRRLAIRLLQRFNPGDISIRHHYTGDKLKLHSFRHKSYWYHGRRREQATMQRLSEMVHPGDFVIEVGAHIGYLSLHLAHLVGTKGQVLVFEPGPNNLEYLAPNVAPKSQIRLVPAAVADFNGTAKFHVENFSGQNNSLLADYGILQQNLQSAGVDSVATSTVEVDCVRLGDYVIEHKLPTPSFIKIDVEGAELMVLKGMTGLLGQPGIALMVEITENSSEVVALLQKHGYRLFTDSCEELHGVPTTRGENVFCLHPSDARVKLFERHRAAA